MAELALVFNGPINHPATTKLRNAICNAANGGFILPGLPQGTVPTKLHLLLNSGGGSIEDGFSLYSLLRSIKPEVVTVNMGLIASIANVIFLAGSRRVAAPESIFQFHDFDWTFAGAHSMDQHNLAYTSQQLNAWKAHKRALFKARTKLTDADFETVKFLEHSWVVDPAAAKTYDIVQDVSLPRMAPGTPILNVEY